MFRVFGVVHATAMLCYSINDFDFVTSLKKAVTPGAVRTGEFLL